MKKFFLTTIIALVLLCSQNASVNGQSAFTGLGSWNRAGYTPVSNADLATIASTGRTLVHTINNESPFTTGFSESYTVQVGDRFTMECTVSFITMTVTSGDTINCDEVTDDGELSSGNVYEVNIAGSYTFSCEVYSGSGYCVFRIYRLNPTPTPTPTSTATATPTGAATALPVSTQSCVVPTQRPTKTPVPTRTPFGGTPSPTATGPTPTPTPGAVQSSSVITFPENLNPFTKLFNAGSFGGVLSDTQWMSTTGDDGKVGVAFVGFYTDTGTMTMSVASALRPGLVYAVINNPQRILLSGIAKTDVISPGHSAEVVLWAFASNVTDTLSPFGTWLRLDSAFVTSEWRYWQISSATPNTATITFIAITARKFNQALNIYANRGGVMLDDIRVVVGDEGIVGSLGGLLPVCSGSTTFTNPGNIPTKVCVVNRVMIDVFAACVAPDGIDVWAWINWLWCRIYKYFAWDEANTVQLQDLQDRQLLNEPLGSIVELSDVYRSADAYIRALNDTQTDIVVIPVDLGIFLQRGFDFDFDFESLKQTPSSTLEDFRAGCPQQLEALNPGQAELGICYTLAKFRQTPLIGLMQLLINLAAVYGLYRYTAKTIAGLAVMEA
jgi:hypothetical protein